ATCALLPTKSSSTRQFTVICQIAVHHQRLSQVESAMQSVKMPTQKRLVIFTTVSCLMEPTHASRYLVEVSPVRHFHSIMAVSKITAVLFQPALISVPILAYLLPKPALSITMVSMAVTRLGHLGLTVNWHRNATPTKPAKNCYTI